ncbi:MAG: hypothetical protein Q9162_006039 [Coniocarpon cinnabarinum]
MDDYRLAPILDDAALFGQQGQDLLSLDLPPIQDSALAKGLQLDASQDPPLTPNYIKDISENDSSPLGPHRNQLHGSGQHQSTLPIASVLNDDGDGSGNRVSEPVFTNSERQQDLHDAEAGPSQTLQLPQPQIQQSADIQMPLIPPLLQGLHDPPPDAGLIPRITEDKAQNRLGLWSRRRGLAALTADEIGNAVHKDGDYAVSGRSQPGEDTSQQRHPTKEHDKYARKNSGSSRRKNKKWTKQETLDLLRGVSKHGVGAWRRILSDHDFSFEGRTHVDLKDKYRVCCSRKETEPQQILASPSLKAVCNSDRMAMSTSIEPRRGRSDADSKPTVEELAEQQLHPATMLKSKSSTRRERHTWSAAEDAALLSGFEKHGPRWVEIIKDPALVLHSRTRNDARDRWRIMTKKTSDGLKKPDASRREDEQSSQYHEQLRPAGAEDPLAFVDPAATWRPVSRVR